MRNYTDLMNSLRGLIKKTIEADVVKLVNELTDSKFTEKEILAKWNAPAEVIKKEKVKHVKLIPITEENKKALYDEVFRILDEHEVIYPYNLAYIGRLLFANNLDYKQYNPKLKEFLISIGCDIQIEQSNYPPKAFLIK